MWWEGPNWLHFSAQDWPFSPEADDCPRPDEEKPSSSEIALVAISDFSLLDRISSYSRLQQVTAWVLWFVTNTRVSRELRKKDYLSPNEFTDVEMFWVKSTQLVDFS